MRMAERVERRLFDAGGLLDGPVEGGRKSGKKKAAKDDLLKERRKRDAEGKGATRRAAASVRWAAASLSSE